MRDPRDVVVSYANHLGLSYDEVITTMLNSHASGIKKFNDNEFDIEIMGRWADNYNSWKDYKGRDFLIVRYEDLVAKKTTEFLKILNYLKNLSNIDVNIDQMNKSIKDTSFEKLKELYGFDQATGNGPFLEKALVIGKRNLKKNRSKKLKTLKK